MSIKEKLSHAVEDIKGKGKETAGSVNGDESLRQEGKTDQTKADFKERGRHLKDAVT